uniref:Putative ribonuclease H-like domain-containing protein n=1 Tax=Tanacetum cinerariifolium TaxID=118510 RepID=A0A6L2JIW0_TANCI|nr:putative ribonuclease H-like domain-containing protein [Tanacetum cinerariifolium]
MVRDDNNDGDHPKTSNTSPPVPPPTQQIPHTVLSIKLPILKKREYNICAMKMEHYLSHTNYPIWQVIQNGNGPVSITTDTNEIIKVLPPKTTKEVVARERKRKSRTTLLMALPEDHLEKFHKMADAKEMWEAIKSRFGGNYESKKMHKYLLRQQFEGFSMSTSEGLHKGYDRFQTLLGQLEIHGAGVSHEDANQKFLRSLPSSLSQVALIMRTKPGLDILSFDDLYNNLRVFERDVKGTTASSSNTHNVAFVSTENTSSTNDVSTTYSVSSPSVSKSQKEGSSSYTDEVIQSFFSNQSNTPQLDYDDLEQINDDDMEEMDLKWQVAMISMRIKKFHKRTGRKLQFDTKDPVGFDKTKDDSKSLVTIDGKDIDWSGHVKEDAQNYAMMAYSSSNSGSNNKSMFMNKASDLEDTSVNDRFADGTHATSSNESDSKPSEYVSCEYESGVETSTSMPEPVENASKVVCEHKVWTDAPFIKEYESASDNDSVSNVQEDKEKPNFAFTDSVKHVKTSREHIKKTGTTNHNPKIEKHDRNGHTKKGLGYAFTRKACFVCGSFSHLIIDCDFHEKRMAKQAELTKNKNKVTGQRENRPVWNNVQRVNHQNKFVPSAEAVNTTCYVLNRVLVTKPQNKTPYELLTENQGNKSSCPQEANNNAGTQANDDQGANLEEIDLNEEHFVLPIWSAYSTTVKSSDDKIEKNTSFKTCEKPVSQVEQVFMDELEKLKRQEKEANVAAESLRKEATHDIQNASTSSTNLLNTTSTPLSTTGPLRAFDDGEILYHDPYKYALPNDPSMCHPEDIYASPSEGIFTDSSYDDEGVSAFLYGTIDEEVYVSQPHGFVDPKFPNKVYKVVKALYGLHQAPRAWYAILSTFLKKNDIIFGSTKKSWCDEFEKLMKNRFQMSSMGELTFFLGLQVKQNEDGIFISQDKYVAEILKKFDFLSVKTASTPIKTQKPLVKVEDDADVDGHLYRFQVTLKTSHLHAVKRIFRYLKGQPKLGLWYPKVSSFDLEAYSNSDYTGANLDRKSITGGCQFFGRRLILWQCKKQTIVATSTTEAEYVAAAHYFRQVLWIQNQLLDYGFNFMNTKIYIDNESTICIVKNTVFHSKIKHIKIRYHFIRDAYEKKLIQVLKIHTDDNVADLLTKAFDVSSKELASPKQTALGKYISNPLMAGRFPKTTFPTSSVSYALIASPTIRTSCIKQFWTTTKVKTINNEVRIQVLTDEKRVNIKESSIRRTLKLEDAEGTSCLANVEIFDGLAKMGYEKLSEKLTFYKAFFSPNGSS